MVLSLALDSLPAPVVRLNVALLQIVRQSVFELFAFPAMGISSGPLCYTDVATF